MSHTRLFNKFFYLLVLGNKIKTRQKICSDLMQQIKRREDFLDRMTEEEQVLEKTFCKMAQAELEKELASKKYNRVRIIFLRIHTKPIHTLISLKVFHVVFETGIAYIRYLTQYRNFLHGLPSNRFQRNFAPFLVSDIRVTCSTHHVS